MGVMPGISRRLDPRRSRVVRADDGFGLIEVMVSMVLLTTLALATFSLIDRSTAVSAMVRSKSVAADIAHDDLNRMRQLKFSLASSATYQATSTVAGVDGVNYTVNSTASWATDTGVETSCTTPTTAGTSAYLHIQSKVTWPGMGSAAPVLADSILAPRGKESNRTAGSLMVKVQDRDAAPISGAQVDVAGQSLATSAAGCVFFPAINAGQWPVTISKSAMPYNYMDSDGDSPGTTTASVVVGDVSTVSVSFDIPAQFKPITLVREDGTTGTGWTSVSLATQSKTISVANTAAPTTPKTSFDSGLVFPFASGWGFYAGNCGGNDPTVYANNTTTALPNSAIKPDRGATVTNGVAYMRAVTLSVISPKAETLIYRVRPYKDTTYTSMSGCAEAPADGSITVVANTAKTATVDLPYGLYSVCAENALSLTDPNYRFGKFTGATNPTGAYHVMPYMNGAVTLKASAPTNDTGTAGVTLSHPSTAPSTDPCA
jgi:prepilin-type N-terminal cleavage/methylation domain-containing protein